MRQFDSHVSLKIDTNVETLELLKELDLACKLKNSDNQIVYLDAYL